MSASFYVRKNTCGVVLFDTDFNRLLLLEVDYELIDDKIDKYRSLLSAHKGKTLIVLILGLFIDESYVTDLLQSLDISELMFETSVKEGALYTIEACSYYDSFSGDTRVSLNIKQV